jgi:hypothetical protein
MFFCRLTPELSRAERGGWEPVLLARPEVSTKPRYGVGLNDLLGGKEAGEGETPAHLPKAEARTHERALRTFSRTCQKRQHVEPRDITKEIAVSEAGERNACEVRARPAISPKRQRAENLSEEHNQPKPANYNCDQSNYRMLFTA